MDDDEAISRSLAGDLDAYEALVTRYSAVAHRTAGLLGTVKSRTFRGLRRLREEVGDELS